MNDSSTIKFSEVSRQRSNKPLTLLQFSDLHLLANPKDTLIGINTEESFLSVVHSARERCWPPNLILLTGDLAQDPLISTYQRLKSHLHKLKSPCYCLPGNHDKPLMAEVLNGQNVSCEKSIRLGNWKVICLDSTVPNVEGGRLSDTTLERLNNDLQDDPDTHILIALHHHPIPIGCIWLDTMVLENGEQLFSILRKFPQVKAVICGHIHQEMDYIHHNIRLIGTPSTCFQFKQNVQEFALDQKSAGFRPLKLYPDGSIETWVERLSKLPNGLNLTSSGY